MGVGGLTDMEPTESIRISHPPDFPDLEVWSVKNCSRCPSVYHETFTICAVLPATRGRSEWTYRKRSHQSTAGHLMMMEPGELHVTRRVTGAGTYNVFGLPADLVLAAARDLGLRRFPHLRDANITFEPLLRALGRFHRSLETSATVLERESRLTQCLHLFLEHCLEDQPPPLMAAARMGLSRAREYVHAHFERKISLDRLAGLAGLSKFHFLRAFQEAFGAPPHAFQNFLRIAKAKALMVQGVPPRDVEVGFADQSHFIRLFKRANLVTPAAYASGL